MSLHLTKGSTYEDRDGQAKNYTVVDWSRKTQVGQTSYTEEEKQEIKNSLSRYKTDLIDRLTVINPFYVMKLFPQLVLRGKDVNRLGWNTAMLRDEGMDIDTLRIVLTFAENNMELDRENNFKDYLEVSK